ncbi:MAG TPA: serine/threonine-protein kinase, partial [Candidatus Solibacter sp.]|nr:serine/threonine-protein kinase [Candidatus Solibacter sp.]
MAIVTKALRRLPGERDTYIRSACQGDEALLREVGEALEWEARMSGPLRQPATSARPTLGMGAHPMTGAVIGPYRLIEKIGEGGMAEVWRGEQTTPVRRTVAIKLIKAGMETKAMIARFESERQALALMDHPAIARVFDAGATAEGMPYFVMEYVPGMPITEYCDKYRLSTRERLELFMQVCEGVQHAHQKAIIHRDLKPSNVLISVQDGKPAIKIIDFGVAKALAQRLTEKTMFTEMGMLVGTPEYMSPEQAELTGRNVDTRTDVYSLGLILYELLVGALPFDSRELRRAGFAEILRRIREEDPPRPSTRLRTLGDSLAESARNRKTEPGVLARQLQVDLDWIAMKALEKDQTRRYGSPSDLAAEIGRYLRDEPVLASPPSVAYRAGKFARRHRAGVGVAAGVFLLLLGFAITMTVQARRIARERDRANREAEV